MLLLGFWVLAAVQSPAPGASSQLVLGLAAVAAAMLVVLAAAVPAVPAPRPAAAGPARGVRARAGRLPRLLDPDAAGRPRPRAPTAYPAVLLPRLAAS
ncbi:DUF6412 domain-containing protein [Actinoplanes sp. NPDC049118]|uniref:DUF6412 domain-containing protein n=1 Tax=Actinoplanes sp. NPDC049118 TaxID=3155769 RepID=UPI0033D6F442